LEYKEMKNLGTKILLLAVAALVFLSSARAQGPALTQISDTLFFQNGSENTGTVTITNAVTFTSADGYVVVANAQVVVTVTNGALNASLVPNAGSTPSGSYYIANYNIDGAKFQEYWVVPSSGSAVKLSAVRALAPPASSILVAFSQISPPSPCPLNDFPQWTSTGWGCSSPSGSFSAGGDLSGSSSSQTVIGLRGISLPTLAASTGYFYDNNGVLSLSTSASNLTSGTLPHAQLPALVSGDIPNNAANTSGTAGGLSGTPSIAVSGVSDSALTASLPVCTDASKNLSSTCTGLVTNADLANSAITIAGASVSLGGSTVSFPSPGAIGGTTPAAGDFTTLTAHTQLNAGLAGTLAPLVMGNATSGLITLEPGTGAITSYTIQLPIAQPTSGNTILTCTAANPAVCTWGSGASSGVSSFTGDSHIITNSASTGAVTVTIAGTSGGIPYFSSSSAWQSSAALAQYGIVQGGGAGAAPSTISPAAGYTGVAQGLSCITGSPCTIAPEGVPVDASNPATFPEGDRLAYVKWSSGSTLTIPALTNANGLDQNVAFVLQNISGGPLAITPSSPNNIDGGSSQAPSNVLNNFAVWTLSDGTPNLWTIKVPTAAAFGSNCSNGLTWSTSTGFSCLAGLPVMNTGTPSDVTAQSTSQSAVTLASSPAAGAYELKFYADVNTPCTTGGNSVSFVFNWTDGTSARSLQTGSLSMAQGAPAGSAYLSGVARVQVGSGNLTYTSTVSGSCASGTSSYDIHAEAVRIR
jgi:hypothetical protein